MSDGRTTTSARPRRRSIVAVSIAAVVGIVIAVIVFANGEFRAAIPAGGIGAFLIAFVASSGTAGSRAWAGVAALGAAVVFAGVAAVLLVLATASVGS